ncbi:translocation/assembly module TamB domain-containing protein [Prolixibacteraceae bacterium Z1-6]|uniref:Translocation/assembly module TamB domain-containing protein n=1 Tax=Draconibacterium aestuarii TaxID=2998507 RepID=A0A9X3F855_9BACT|nr:translocation/assembly module TamB domain-containing protein [Prolixibacteraceae bacterium Z1-6]
MKITIIVLAALITLLGSCYFALQTSWVQTQITKKIAERLSEQLNTTISVGKVDIGFFNRLYLEDVLIEDRNRDTLLYSQLITAKIDTLKIKKQRLAINELILKNNQLNIVRDSSDTYNFSFILNSFNKPTDRDSLKRWEISCEHFDFGQINISYSDIHETNQKQFIIHDLNTEVSEFHSMADSLSFQLNQLSLNDGGNIILQDASALVHLRGGKVNINEFNMKTAHSEIENSDLQLQFFVQSDSMKTPFDIDFRIGKSKINFREIGELVPLFKGMDQEIELSGLIYGNQNDLKGKNLYLTTGMETQAILDFYINDLTHPKDMYLFLDLKSSETSFSDLSNIRLPNTLKYRYLQFPESFYTAGLLKFRGNFSGFLSDFVTFGTLESQMGKLTTDIMVMPEKEGTIYYRGNIATTNFQLGQLFQNSNLGNLTFSGSADGKYIEKTEAISGVFKGDIKEIYLYDYNYKDIKFDGILANKMFDGLLSINDPNLQFSFLGELDLNKELPHFDYTLDLKKALPNKLKLGRNFPNAEVAFKMNANFEGDQIDNINGAIRIQEGIYKNRNGAVDLGGMMLKTITQEQGNSLLFGSDFFDVSVSGKYNFRSILNSFEKIIHHYVSAYPYEKEENSELNNFEYQLNVKDINELSKIFIPGMEFETPFLLYGEIDSPNNNFQLTGSIPGLKWRNLWARNIFIGNKGIEDQYSSKFRIGELFSKNGLRLYNFSIDSKINDNILNNVISWSNFDELTYSGTLRTQTQFFNTDTTNQRHIEIKGLPSQIYIADTLWSIAPYVALLDSSSLEVKNFNMSHGNQEITAKGKITEGKTDQLDINIKNINLGYLNEYFNRDFMLEGMANGSFSISKDLDSPVILSDLEIDELHYKNQYLGNISLNSRWNNSQSSIDSELNITRNDRTSLRALGYYKPSTKELNFNAEVDSLSLMILDVFMKKNFSNIKGTGSGKARISGTLDKIAIDGAVMAKEAGLTVNVTQIPYSFTDSIYFKDNTIRFDNIVIYDDRNNPGIFDGTIEHKNFSDMIFDLHFSSRKIRALNTTSIDNAQFYGVAIANGRFDITGPITATKLSGSATTLNGTDLSISMESESDIEKYDFIEFVAPAKSEEDNFFEDVVKKQGGKYNLSLTVEATPEAKVQIIYNSQIGDIIKAQGEGILLFEMDDEYNMSLSGNYNPTKGDYLFTLQNVINKRFTIEQGGSIIWSGDPYNAIIDLKAIYKLKTSLYDLLMDYDYVSQSQRIQVECIIELEDELANPTIGFDINFPSADERIKDDLRQFFNTDEEMNKQILSLIVLGKFYTPDYMRGTYDAQNANAIGTTASEVFSNQLSNWLSQISSKWDVGLNYRPGNQVTDDEIEVALSTQIFNDRVSLNGNIGNNTNEYTNNSSQIVGDFEMSVKLVPSGKIQFKAYNRSNNNLIYETAPYTQGIGLSFKEEYNSFEELFQKMTRIFKKKN